MASSLPDEVLGHLSEQAKASGLPILLSKLLEAVREIGTTLRSCGYSSSHVGTQNAFGDHQLDVDVKTDEVVFRCLRESLLVHVAASEENPVELACGGTGYSVAFDPLDGSSIVDCNFAVGTIVGIWTGNGLLNRLGKEQAASFVAQYGPRVTIALALASGSTASGQALAIELTMHPDNWVVSRSKLVIAAKAKTFAPGNLRATSDNPQYQRLVAYWIEHKYTLRYSGGLVPDVYHILIKGEGVLANASSPTAKVVPPPYENTRMHTPSYFDSRTPHVLTFSFAGQVAAAVRGCTHRTHRRGRRGRVLCVPERSCRGARACLAARRARQVTCYHRALGMKRRPAGHMEPHYPTHLLPFFKTIRHAGSDLDKRVGVCYGSSEEVERFKAHIFA